MKSEIKFEVSKTYGAPSRGGGLSEVKGEGVRVRQDIGTMWQRGAELSMERGESVGGHWVWLAPAVQPYNRFARVGGLNQRDALREYCKLLFECAR